jgi:hypothetical protein
MAQYAAGSIEAPSRSRPSAEVWFEPQPHGGVRPSWMVRGHCIITDTSTLRKSGQVFIAGLNCVPIDVSYIDSRGTVHQINGAGVVELRFDNHDGTDVAVFVHEPPRSAVA